MFVRCLQTICGVHLDTQAMSFQCSFIRSKVTIREKYENLFKPEVSADMAKTLQEILKIRENETWEMRKLECHHMYKKGLVPQQKCDQISI